jgi:hypothetical protein
MLMIMSEANDDMLITEDLLCGETKGVQYFSYTILDLPSGELKISLWCVVMFYSTIHIQSLFCCASGHKE